MSEERNQNATETLFDLEGGALCLDFTNTVDWHASDEPQDRLNDYADLIRWGLATSILDGPQAAQLRELASTQPERAAEAFARAIRLREAIYRLFVDFSEGKTIDEQDLALLNEALVQSLAHLQLVPAVEGFTWAWIEGAVELDHIRYAVARSAAELLTGDRLDRVRQCADDRGCGYLFLDTSRNRSRRWCSMESCGNRAKVRRHYRRQQENQG